MAIKYSRQYECGCQYQIYPDGRWGFQRSLTCDLAITNHVRGWIRSRRIQDPLLSENLKKPPRKRDPNSRF